MPKALSPLSKASSSLRQLRLLLADFDEAQLAATLAFARAIAKSPQDEELLPPERTALDDLLLAPGQDFRYVCSLPEGAWALRLRVVACLPPEACVGRPALEGGQRPAPPWRWGRPQGPGGLGLAAGLEASRVDWGALREAFLAAPWAAHRRPWRLGEADPIHGLLRG